ncbi:MAG: hypothetical protein AAF215_12230 [Cyanobacteria bacterium P01_A01_bin.123]
MKRLNSVSFKSIAMMLGLLGALVAIKTVDQLQVPLSKRLNFEDIRDGKRIPGTDYIYSFREYERVFPGGTPHRAAEVYLLNEETDSLLPVPIDPDESLTKPKEFVCESCVTTIHLQDRIYLVTAVHNGGSGGFYGNTVLEIVDDQIIERERYGSCGNVYLLNQTLIFPRHEYDCPESVLSQTFVGWEYYLFDLAEQ